MDIWVDVWNEKKRELMNRLGINTTQKRLLTGRRNQRTDLPVQNNKLRYP